MRTSIPSNAVALTSVSFKCLERIILKQMSAIWIEFIWF